MDKYVGDYLWVGNFDDFFPGKPKEKKKEKKKESEDTMKGKRIEKVIISDPATIIFWGNGSKTLVKCTPGETFDPEKGFLMAFFQSYSGMTKTQTAKYLRKIIKENERKENE